LRKQKASPTLKVDPSIMSSQWAIRKKPIKSIRISISTPLCLLASQTRENPFQWQFKKLNDPLNCDITFYCFPMKSFFPTPLAARVGGELIPWLVLIASNQSKTGWWEEEKEEKT
jgi:hypothetical protein